MLMLMLVDDEGVAVLRVADAVVGYGCDDLHLFLYSMYYFNAKLLDLLTLSRFRMYQCTYVHACTYICVYKYMDTVNSSAVSVIKFLIKINFYNFNLR